MSHYRMEEHWKHTNRSFGPHAVRARRRTLRHASSGYGRGRQQQGRQRQQPPQPTTNIHRRLISVRMPGFSGHLVRDVYL